MQQAIDRPLSKPSSFELDVFLDTLPGSVPYVPAIRSRLNLPDVQTAILLLEIMRRSKKKDFRQDWFTIQCEKLGLQSLQIPKMLCERLGITHYETKEALRTLTRRGWLEYVGGVAVFKVATDRVAKQLGV